MLNPLKFLISISTLIYGIYFPLGASTITVSKSASDAGAYQKIQDAVNSSITKDTILILDDGIYQECVTIAFKKDLTIKSSPSLSVKPTITFQDKENTGPKTCEEGKDSATITYQKNGALRILESSNITIEGLTIDGIGAYTFGYPNTWGSTSSCQFPNQSGNSSIALYRSSNVIIKKCEINNAFNGIYITGFVNTIRDGRSVQPSISIDNTTGGTGNHLITECRIHHNTFGLFFENDHDMGIIINNNLFYNNCHTSEAIAEGVRNLTSEGSNLPGGAILFKNLQKTPVAIYNNTFFNNYLLFTSHWRPGDSYLIFNNIYGPPQIYWSAEKVFQNSFMASDPVFSYRTHNCLYACQTESARCTKEVIYQFDNEKQINITVDTLYTYQPRIMNMMGDIEAANVQLNYNGFDTIITMKSPGNRIIGTNNKAFPPTANVRWLEPKFRSTDPSSTEFLMPDWNDSLMRTYVADKGWAESGIRDADGSTADLGAISSCSGQSEQVRILSAATLIDSSPEIIPFYLVSEKPLNDCRLEYCKFLELTNADSNAFGGNASILPLSRIHDVITSGNLTTGLNVLKCIISGTMSKLSYGYFEMVVSGINEHGIRVSSTPGFIPVSIPSAQSRLNLTFRTIDTQTTTATEETIELTLRIRPNASERMVYRDLSLLQMDGSVVKNMHGKKTGLDSLVIPMSAVSDNDLTPYIDTFTVAASAGSNQTLPVLFKAKTEWYSDDFEYREAYTYSTHIVKLTTATSTNNYLHRIILSKSTQQPQSASIYNLMGKKIVTIPFSNFSIPRVQSTLSRGMYIVRFLQVNGNQIKEAGTTKFIVQ